MQNKNLTIMFTDMKGFTSRTSEQSRSETMVMLQKHEELLLPLITARGGKLVKTIGDAFLVTFESPTDAVLAGVELQARLSEHNKEVLHESERIEIRIAINTGEVSETNTDIYGEAVNIAARIEGLAEPNEIYFTESTFLSMNKSEVPTAEIGYRALKGIPTKIKVYKVLREGEEAPEVTHVMEVNPLVEAQKEPAPHWKRICAFIIDALICLIIAGVMNGTDKRTMAIEMQALAEQREAITQNLGAEGVPDERIEALLDNIEDPPLDTPLFGQVMDWRHRKAGWVELEENTRRPVDIMAGGLFILYTTLAHGLLGFTLGKRALGLQVVTVGEKPMSIKTAALRSFLYIGSTLPLALGFFWIFWDPKRQGWHDKIADTRVIQLPKAEQ